MVRRARALGLLIAIAAVCAGSARAPAQAPAAPRPVGSDPANGRLLFTRMTCHYCHGTEGQGSIVGVGPRVARPARSYESFARYVRRPSGRMTAFSETILPDAALSDIYAFLRSLPAARPVDEIPLLGRLRQR
jgi:mono/diheme cytochrome c family protein